MARYRKQRRILKKKLKLNREKRKARSINLKENKEILYEHNFIETFSSSMVASVSTEGLEEEERILERMQWETSSSIGESSLNISAKDSIEGMSASQIMQKILEELPPVEEVVKANKPRKPIVEDYETNIPAASYYTQQFSFEEGFNETVDDDVQAVYDRKK